MPTTKKINKIINARAGEASTDSRADGAGDAGTTYARLGCERGCMHRADEECRAKCVA